MAGLQVSARSTLTAILIFQASHFSVSADAIFVNEEAQFSEEYRGGLSLDTGDWKSIRAATIDVTRENIEDVWDPPPWIDQEIRFEICGSISITETDATLLDSFGYGPSDGPSELLWTIDKFSTVQVVFEKSPYPDEVWRSVFEALQLVRHEVSFEDETYIRYHFALPVDPSSEANESYRLVTSTYDLADEINSMAETLGLELPRVQIGDDCGGGEVPIDIQIDDPAARIWRISGFHYKLCEIRGVDPQSLTLCPGWSEITGQSSVYAAGWIQFFVIWSDGVESMTRTKITNAMYEDSLRILR